MTLFSMVDIGKSALVRVLFPRFLHYAKPPLRFFDTYLQDDGIDFTGFPHRYIDFSRFDTSSS